MRGLDYGFEFVGFMEGWRGLVEGKTMPVTESSILTVLRERAMLALSVVGLDGLVIGASNLHRGQVRKFVRRWRRHRSGAGWLRTLLGKEMKKTGERAILRTTAAGEPS